MGELLGCPGLAAALVPAYSLPEEEIVILLFVIAAPEQCISSSPICTINAPDDGK